MCVQVVRLPGCVGADCSSCCHCWQPPPCILLLQVTWIINATRSATFTGSLTGSVRIARTLTQTGGISWSAVGISVKQVGVLWVGWWVGG